MIKVKQDIMEHECPFCSRKIGHHKKEMGNRCKNIAELYMLMFQIMEDKLP